jgi:hypothetical protein
MKTRAALATVLLIALAAVAAANAAPNTAETTLQDAPVSGATLDVRFEVTGTTPVVPHEYAMRNTCTSKNGNFTIGQRDDIVTWLDEDLNGKPEATMPVYLQSIPSGWKCKVSLVKGNTIVKGSTESYTVG